MPDKITVYDGKDGADIARMVATIEAAFRGATVPAEDAEAPEEAKARIPVFEDLIGIDDEVYRQINGALSSGVRNLMFYGPPGTGKTTLAQRVAGYLSDDWKLITGSSDWSSQDIIGGYFPLGDGKIAFLPGVLLEHFDKPLIIDELNRCDIDKVIGPLFTVLSGQGTTLPYLTVPTDPKSPRIEILPKGKSEPPRAYAPSADWRLIATINSIDKASLYQMSYALTRRFAWIYIDVPADLENFVRKYVQKARGGEEQDHKAAPLAAIWREVNEVRRVGPAPIIDIIKFILSDHPVFCFFGVDAVVPEPYLDGFYVFLMPMLDGILRSQGEHLADRIAEILGVKASDECRKLKERLGAMTV